jgi:O-methyltransferase involved in polyketide biosynthesis
MSRRPITPQLKDVPETMLVTLYSRAFETRQPDPIIEDYRAVDLVASIDYDFSRFDAAHATHLGVAIRTEILDELTNAFLAAHPDAMVVNIAAGLDTRINRVDNGRLAWVDLDLPETMAVRRQFYAESNRHRLIAGSALDTGWLDSIADWRAERPHVLIIIEGLLMYFTEAQVQALLVNLAQSFPGGEALAEVMGVSQARRTDRDKAISQTSAQFQWGIRHAPDMADWDPRIHYITDISFYDRHEARWLALDLEWTAPIVALRNTVNRIVHLRFAE